MNSAEKKVFHIAVALFIVGLVVRFLPWGIPSIEQEDDLFGRETAVASVARSGSGGKSVPEVTDKVIKKRGVKRREKSSVCPSISTGPRKTNYAP